MRLFDLFISASTVIVGGGICTAILVALVIRLTDWLENRRDLRLAQQRFAHHQRKVG